MTTSIKAKINKTAKSNKVLAINARHIGYLHLTLIRPGRMTHPIMLSKIIHDYYGGKSMDTACWYNLIKIKQILPLLPSTKGHVNFHDI